jgi:hypothetical protein
MLSWSPKREAAGAAQSEGGSPRLPGANQLLAQTKLQLEEEPPNINDVF